MPYSDLAVDIAPETGLNAETATGEELHRVGLAYSEGVDCEQDLIAAHKWFNLAALRGNEEAKRYRMEISRDLTRAEVSKAQRLARKWLAVH